MLIPVKTIEVINEKYQYKLIYKLCIKKKHWKEKTISKLSQTKNLRIYIGDKTIGPHFLRSNVLKNILHQIEISLYQTNSNWKWKYYGD